MTDKLVKIQKSTFPIRISKKAFIKEMKAKTILSKNQIGKTKLKKEQY